MRKRQGLRPRWQNVTPKRQHVDVSRGQNMSSKFFENTAKYRAKLLEAPYIPMLGPGQSAEMQVFFENTGHEIWNHNTRLGTSTPNDRTSVFSAEWQSSARACSVLQKTLPGQIGAFVFTIKVPEDFKPGIYTEELCLVQDGVTWFFDEARVILKINVCEEGLIKKEQALLPKLKLLYISSWHCTLEYDELNLFTKLGIDWFSTGKYALPRSPIADSLRPPIDKAPNIKLYNKFKALNMHHAPWTKIFLTKEFVDNFDVVYVGHCTPHAEYLDEVWQYISHKPVIWRTYCLQTSEQERAARQYKLQNDNFFAVRFTEKEKVIKGYSDICSAVIPLYVDEDEYSEWNGKTKGVLTFQNFYMSRHAAHHYDLYEQAVKQFQPRLHGVYTTGCSWAGETLTPEQQKKAYQDFRVYFALGSKPSSITYNLIEAMMTGCPVVTWGYKYGADPKSNMYEVPEFIENGKNGFCADSVDEFQQYIQLLMNDHDLAKEISKNSRETAIRLFGKDVALEKWKKFFNQIGFAL